MLGNKGHNTKGSTTANYRLNRYDANGSHKKITRIFLPMNKATKREEDPRFVGRGEMMERLFRWLTDKHGNNGTYLITGYRGMGKSTIVERVLSSLCREIDDSIEILCRLSLFLLMAFAFTFTFTYYTFMDTDVFDFKCPEWLPYVFLFLFIIVFTYLIYNSEKHKTDINNAVNEFTDIKFDRSLLKKFLFKNDKTNKKYSDINIKINLGHDVIKERDVMCLIALGIYDKYKKFVKSVQPRFIMVHIIVAAVSVCSALMIEPLLYVFFEFVRNNPIQTQSDSVFLNIIRYIFLGVNHFSNRFDIISCIVDFIIISLLLMLVIKFIFRMLPMCSAPRRILKRLSLLCERLSASIDIESGVVSDVNNRLISISLFGGKKKKVYSVADVREIEYELMEIINEISSSTRTPNMYRANFYIVFDEMDKIEAEKISEQPKFKEAPKYTDYVDGFPGGINSRERKANVLRLLGNIKMFVTSAHAKFIFISGRELYEAYLADLSDRDFAISSIFSGVMNIDSFLSPEEEEIDVKSMSEWYIVNRILPNDFLIRKERENANANKVLKKEHPTLRWCYEYFMDLHKGMDRDNEDKRKDVEYIVSFLYTFSIYLTHVSKGSPKKLSMYFDKYVKRNIEVRPFSNFNCSVSVGKDEHNDEQQVLCFDVNQQRTISFMRYVSNPIINTITNNMSRYGDSYLVSLSFITDHIYKYHNRSFSWRHLEQIPELLNSNRVPELRELLASVMELMKQIHVAPVLLGLNEFKFHTSISKEISYMSKVSAEVSAIFNFTLDESRSVIQYNTSLLNYYNYNLNVQNDNDSNRYASVLARIHISLGDLHFFDENFYNAALEYRMVLELLKCSESLDSDKKKDNFLSTVNTTLKLGLTYEYGNMLPNAYETYCNIISTLIKNRDIKESDLGLEVMEARSGDWKRKNPILVRVPENVHLQKNDDTYMKQIKHVLYEDDKNFRNSRMGMEYSLDFDKAISGLSDDLTLEKANIVSRLTLFEEVRYIYQAVLAKLFVLEKMGMSGITQTNIDVAEAEFIILQRAMNVKEKFIVSGDFFRKMAEILFYKNSLTILGSAPDSLYASVYFGDKDMLECINDFCFYKYGRDGDRTNAYEIKKEIIDWMENLKNNEDIYALLKDCNKMSAMFDVLLLQDGMNQNIREYLQYCSEWFGESVIGYRFSNIDECARHRKYLNEKNLRPSCYACKYYNRSLKILTENMFVEDSEKTDYQSKSLMILKKSFKSSLRYTRLNQVVVLAKSIEGLGNVLFSCSALKNYEDDVYRKGISPEIIRLLTDLAVCKDEKEEHDVINELIDTFDDVQKLPMTRLDKSILYLWEAARFYLIVSRYDEAVKCLNNIVSVITHYIGVLNYYKTKDDISWYDESDTVEFLVLNDEDSRRESFVSVIFRLIARFTEYQYDLAGLPEITELKWIFSKDNFEDADLSKISLYPNLRLAFLRILEIKTQGYSYLIYKNNDKVNRDTYINFIKNTYNLISPYRREETMFRAEVLGYYTKVRYNCCILSDALERYPLLDKSDILQYNKGFPAVVFKKFYEYLSRNNSDCHLDTAVFGVGNSIGEKLDFLEFLICDSISCLVDMLRVFTPHDQSAMFPMSFIAITYNYLWEWSRFYELLYDLYDYKYYVLKGDLNAAEQVINHVTGTLKGDNVDKDSEIVREYITRIGKLIPEDMFFDAYGDLSTRLYMKVRRDIPDAFLNHIFSNYSAEMAIRYYYITEEISTEGDAYRAFVDNMYFLNDDFDNDTCGFNTACERFLLNCEIINNQKFKLHGLYQESNVYSLDKSYLRFGGGNEREQIGDTDRFIRSLNKNSEVI